MLYCVVGKDFSAVQKKRDAVLGVLREKRPEAELFVLESDTFDESALDSLIFGQGLFDEKHIVLGTRLCEVLEIKETLLGKLEEIAESPNVFLLAEVSLDTKTVGEVKKHAQQFYELDAASGARGKVAGARGVARSGEAFNIFSLGDALGRRDRKGLWVLYQQALRSGAAAEEIHGTLFWQVKSILLAKSASSAVEAGMKDYPYRKAAGFARSFTTLELAHLSRALVALPYETRRAGGDLETTLERFILTL